MIHVHAPHSKNAESQGEKLKGSKINVTHHLQGKPIKINRGCFISIVQFSRSVMSNSLWPHGLQHARLPCPSPTLIACSNPCPSSRWCHPTVSSCVIPLSSYLQSFLASGSFPMSQFFTSVGQRIEASASASVLLMNIQDWCLVLTVTSWPAYRFLRRQVTWSGIPSL